MAIPIEVFPKQKQVLSAIRGGEAKEIVYGGAMGSGKSYLIALIASSLARQHPGITVGVFRKNRSTLKRTTLESFFEYLNNIGAEEGRDYTFNAGELVFTFPHPGSVSSKVMFLELDGTKDRNYNKVRSLNLTCAFVDEVNECEREGWIALLARVGRRNTDANGYKIPAFLMGTCNPDVNWVKDDFYTPFKKGILPYNKMFIPALPSDNPRLPEEYIQQLESMPEQFKQLYLYGNWDYSDDDNSLFKHMHIDRGTITDLNILYQVDSEGKSTRIIDPSQRFIGVDVAREGRDKTVFAMVDNGQLVDIYVPNITVDDKAPILMQVADEVIKYAERNQVGYEHVAIDAVGVGGGVVDSCRQQGYYVMEYKAGSNDVKRDSRGLPMYDNIRSEAFWQLSDALQKGEFTIYSGIDHYAELKKDLVVHTYEITDKVTKVESKTQLKKRLGASPDFADALSIAWWASKQEANSYEEIAILY